MLGHILEAIADLAALPFGSRKGKTQNERLQFVFAVAFWVVLLLGIAYGALSFFFTSH